MDVLVLENWVLTRQQWKSQLLPSAKIVKRL
jgi:hypothetical protein